MEAVGGKAARHLTKRAYFHYESGSERPYLPCCPAIFGEIPERSKGADCKSVG